MSLVPEYAVEVVLEAVPSVEVVVAQTTVIEVGTGVRGPAGPAGDAAALVWTQSTPLATWTIPHSLARLPSVAVYIGGELVLAPTTSTTTTVTITFPSPQSGFAILN
jgi:hypothetical protein